MRAVHRLSSKNTLLKHTHVTLPSHRLQLEYPSKDDRYCPSKCSRLNEDVEAVSGMFENASESELHRRVFHGLQSPAAARQVGCNPYGLYLSGVSLEWTSPFSEGPLGVPGQARSAEIHISRPKVDLTQFSSRNVRTNSGRIKSSSTSVLYISLSAPSPKRQLSTRWLLSTPKMLAPAPRIRCASYSTVVKLEYDEEIHLPRSPSPVMHNSDASPSETRPMSVADVERYQRTLLPTPDWKSSSPNPLLELDLSKSLSPKPKPKPLPKVCQLTPSHSIMTWEIDGDDAISYAAVSVGREDIITDVSQSLLDKTLPHLGSSITREIDDGVASAKSHTKTGSKQLESFPLPQTNCTSPSVQWNRLMSQAWKSLKTPPSVRIDRAQTLYRLEELIKSIYSSEYTLELFGSARYGVSSRRSDLDIVILDSEKPQGDITRRPKPRPGSIYHLRTLARELEKAGYQKVVAIPKAKVPIVKFHDPKTGLDCDINVNDRLGLINTHLIKEYCRLLPILKPTLASLKLWAKPLGHNSPSIVSGPPTFSSYALALMTIGVFQNLGLLPNLQSDVSNLGNGGFYWCDGQRCDTRFHRLEGWTAPAKFSLIELLYLWFKYWATEYDYKNDTINIRAGPVPLRRRKPQSSLEDRIFTGPRILVWDAFELSRNVTRNISSVSLVKFQKDCKQAMETLPITLRELSMLERKRRALAELQKGSISGSQLRT